MPVAPDSRYTAEVLYDRDCGFCGRCVQLLRRIDRRGRVKVLAAQDRGAPERFEISFDEALEQAWAVDSRGDRYGGAGAVNVALGAALGTRIPLYIYRIPGIRWIQDVAYRWVAANRYRLPGKGGTCAVTPN